jgi:hypothetical protein
MLKIEHYKSTSTASQYGQFYRVAVGVKRLYAGWSSDLALWSQLQVPPYKLQFTAWQRQQPAATTVNTGRAEDQANVVVECRSVLA